MDPLFFRAAQQPDGIKKGAAIAFLKMLAKAHDTRNALTEANETGESNLPFTYPCSSSKDIMSEYTDFHTRTGSAFLMESTWEQGTVRNPLSWWQAWAAHLPALLCFARVMKLPLLLAPGERSFSNAAHIQSKVRTRLTHERLHQLLYVSYDSRSLAHLSVGFGGHQMDVMAPSYGCGETPDDTEVVGCDGEREDGLDLMAAAAAMETIIEHCME